MINATLTEGREAVARIHGKVERRRLKDERKNTHTHRQTDKHSYTHTTALSMFSLFSRNVLYNVFSLFIFENIRVIQVEPEAVGG